MARLLVPVAAAVLMCAGIAAAGARTSIVHVQAELRAVDGGRGHGSFSATISGASSRRRFLWTILFFDLSGPAVTADLQVGSPDSNGGVLFTLCHRCSAGRSGSTTLTPRGLRLIASGRVYVVVRTAKHPRGEIGGRLIAAGSSLRGFADSPRLGGA